MLVLSILFWACLLMTLYIYAGYPLILRLWAARTPPRAEPPRDAPLPRVSLLISAYNEQGVIRGKLANALELDYPADRLAIVLVSDGSSDDTVKIARAFDDPRITILDFPERRGKDGALNEALALIHGDVIVFTDANTYYAPDAVMRLARHFADPEVGLVVGQLLFESDAGEPVDGGLYWRLENRLKAWQDALGSVLVANGSIFAVRRELIGPLHGDIANDFQIPMEVGGMGKAIRFEPGALACEKTAIDQDEEFARKVRIVTQGWTGAWRLRRHIRGKRLFLFVSHKLLRWFAGAFQLMLLLTAAALASCSTLFAVILALQLLFYAAALGGYLQRNNPHAHAFLRVPYYFCMVNAAALIALWRTLTGNRIRMWEKAETAR